MWKFECFNKTVFISYKTNLHEAIEDFYKNTNLHLLNIKTITNLH